ncbi:MAG: sigma 54-interacting transcriptional regulator [Acidobacteriota bacterium]
MDSPSTSGGDASAHAETQITDAAGARQDELRLVPGLTLLGHPQADRVGDRLPLPALAAGGDVALSRLEPLFMAVRGGRRRPLGLPHVSRRPVRLRGTAEGAVEVDVRSTRTPIVVDGQPVVDSRRVDAAEIERGVVLEVGNRAVLLLHLVPAEPPPAGEDLGLIGESAALARTRREILRVAGLEVPVLVRGETGTGKELAARALHRESARRTGPFVAVSLASLTPSLAAAELFGAARGAFTGADRRRQGYFQEADGGSLFLDEIGEAPIEVQAMLLRALETGSVTPVGSTESVELDVRVIAATDADLEAAMDARRFRAPLFHRLAGYSLDLPPLRARRDDIGRLLYHFLEADALEHAGRSPGVGSDGRPWPSAAQVARLARADWPGNVRQLRNVARWLQVQGGDESSMEALEQRLGAPSDASTQDEDRVREASDEPNDFARPVSPRSRTLYRAPSEVSDEELLDALRSHGWRLKPAAAQLRVSRTSLYALIDRCPQIRRATDLERDELAVSFERHDGDLAAMADELRVSPQGLRQRLQALGFA